MLTTRENLNPDKRLTAVCGLFCPACSIFIGTHEDPARLQKMAEQRGLPVDEVKCYGCRSDKRYPYCATCKMFVCASAKGLDFCGECADYPCADLIEFQAARPHRLELWPDQARLKEVGYEQWFEEKLAHYACPQCQTINSAYDITCRHCGAAPSCAYGALHQPEIMAYLAQQK